MNIFPPYMTHWNALAQTALDATAQGKWVVAVEKIWNLVQQYPAPQLLNGLGLCLQRLGYAQLAQSCRRYLELLWGPQAPWSRNHSKNKTAEWLVWPEIEAWLTPDQATVSVCLMVRDEAAEIGEFLSHTTAWADDIVVVDTGSTDHTRDLVLTFAPQVRLFEHPWNDDFAAARNAALNQAEGDWILVLDPDERLTPESITWLKQLLVYRPLGLCTISGLVRNDKQTGHQQAWVTRLFPRHPAIRFHGLIHHQLQCFAPPYYLQSIWVETLQVNHWGYQPAVMRRQNKHKRWELLKKSIQDPTYNTPYIHYQYAYALLYLHQPPDPVKALDALAYSWQASLAGLTHGPPTPTWSAASLDWVALLLVRTLHQLGHHQELLNHFRDYFAYGNWTELAWIYAHTCWQQGEIETAKKWAWICFDPDLRHENSPDPYATWRPAWLLLQIAQQEQDDWGTWAWCHQLLDCFPDGGLPPEVPPTDSLWHMHPHLQQRLGHESTLLQHLEAQILSCLEQKQWLQALTFGVYYLSYRTDALIGKYMLLALRETGLFTLAQRLHTVFRFLYPADPDWPVLAPPDAPDTALMHQFSPTFWLAAHYTFTAKPLSLTVAMIVKNESQGIGTCLSALQTVTTEWIIGDTGSTDDTMAVIRQQCPHAHLFEQPWTDDFSHARNWGLQQAMGDWILSVDADEQLSVETISILKQLLHLRLPTRQAFAPSFISLYDNPTMTTVDQIPRIWRRSPWIAFYGRVHNRLGRTDQPLPLHVVALPHITFTHQGFLAQNQRAQHKPERYAALLKSRWNANENNPYIQYHYGHYLVHHHQPPDPIQALQEWEEALAETLRVGEIFPHRGWLPAPLGLTCLAIFRVLRQQQRYADMVQRYPGYGQWGRWDEFHFLYGCALVECQEYAGAIAIFESCENHQWPSLRPQAGYSTWQPLLMLIFCHTVQGNRAAAIDCCYRVLGYLPTGEVPGYGNIQQVLAQLYQQ